MKNEMSEEDFVLYRDKKDNNKIKSLGYTINTVLPYLNMPVMKGGGKIPGRTKENNLTIPVGLALLNDAIIKREKQTNIYNSYIPQEEGVGMLPEELHKHFFEPEDSHTNRRKTRKNRRGGGRRTRKNKKN